MKLIALIAAMLISGSAQAALTRSQLDEIALAPAADARVPLDDTFHDLEGHAVTLGDALGRRPTILLPVDYTCRVTCGPALSILSGALAGTGLTPGRDFRLVLVGIDPRDGAAEAGAFSDPQIEGTPLAAATAILTGDDEAVARLTRAIGYTYVFDTENDAFAHPTGFVALTADGHVARALSSLALNPTDLKLALVEAGQGRIGSVLTRLSLLCYGFDAAHGIYTASIARVLRVAGAATLLLIAGGVGWLSWRGRAGARTA